MRHAALFVVTGLSLAACGGAAKVATTTTPLPTTLPTNLSTVKSFFASQGGGGWTNGDSTATLYNTDGSGTHANGYNQCPTAINGPKGTSNVSLITVTCVVTGPPNSTPQQATPILVGSAQDFAPEAATWVQTALSANKPIDEHKTFGGIVVYLGIGGHQLTWNLAIQATGYQPPPL